MSPGTCYRATTADAACLMRAATAAGWDRYMAWLPGTSTTVEPARSDIALRRRWHHPVLGRDQVPARLDPPGGFGDRPAQGVHAPRDLRVGQERGLLGGQIAGERRGKLLSIQQQEAVL